MSIRMRRTALPELVENEKKWENPSLFFDKGFQEWKIDSGKRGEDIASHIRAVCDIPVSQVYKDAYRRWIGETSDKESFARWFGQLDGTRLFMGLGMAHVLETQVCRHPVYGIPYIPGSALKGLARAKAREYAEGQENQKQFNKVIDILFGTSTDDPKADTGYLIFHDAWWVPGGEEGGSENKPYVPEIVTVHAVEYYKNKGENAPHPDMESPNPNQQLAVQGSFYFVIEGVPQWAELGRKFLTLALEADGIGGKVAAGYGYFVEEEGQKNKREAREKEERDKIAAEEAEKEALRAADEEAERIRIETERVNKLSPEKRLIHDLNVLLDQYGNLSNKIGPAAKKMQSDIQGKVKRILNHNEWHLAGNADKQEALESIERSFPLLLKKNRKKKLDNAKRLLAATNDE